QQVVVLARVVLQVGVLDDQVFAGGLLDTAVNGRTLAHVARLLDEADAHGRVRGHIFLHGGHGAVLGTVVHNHHLFPDPVTQLHVADLVQDQMDGALLVVGGDDDGKRAQHGGRMYGV